MLTRRDAALGTLLGTASAFATRALAQPASVSPAPVAAATPDAEPPAPNDPPTKLGAENDAFEHMVAPVRINGAGPFRFLIDTGANVSCVSLDLAEQLKLAPAGSTSVHTAVGVHTRPSVLIERLDIGTRTRLRVKVAALPTLGPKMDGVLGVDWLSGQRLVLDFKRKNMEITPSRSDNESVDHVIVKARRHLGQLTIVDADLSGHRISAMIDSGSQTTICNTPLREVLGVIEKRSSMLTDHQVIKLESLIGEPFHGELFYLPMLRLGGLNLGNVPCVYADAHIFELWGLKSQPAIVLGMDLLTQFNAVALDYGRSRVAFDLA